MKKLSPLAALVLLLLLSVFAFAHAQAPAVMDAAETQLALKRMTVVGSALYVGAHPDDENTALLAYLASERGVRAAYLSVTRGDGGQNLIGTEQGAALGLVRTQELLAARRIDGAEQFFTRAIDFGFSKSPAETLRVWGHEAALADVVWVVRRFRPDVIITRFPTDGRGRPRPPHRLGHPRARGVRRGGRPGALPRTAQVRQALEAEAAGLERLRPAGRAARRRRQASERGRRRLQPSARQVLHGDRRAEPLDAQKSGHGRGGATRHGAQLLRARRGRGGDRRHLRRRGHDVATRGGRRGRGPPARRGGARFPPVEPARHPAAALARAGRAAQAPGGRPARQREARAALETDPRLHGAVGRGGRSRALRDAGRGRARRRHARQSFRRADALRGRHVLGRQDAGGGRGAEEQPAVDGGAESAGARRIQPAVLAAKGAGRGAVRGRGPAERRRACGGVATSRWS